MKQPGCVIGLDMGTTSVKAVAFDDGGRELTQSAVGLELFHDEEGAAEQDPSAVYDALVSALAATVAHARQLGYRLERVGISAAMHSLIPVAEDGTSLARAMLWMDTRARDEAVALWQSSRGQAIYERTGTPVHPMAPLAKLLWMRAQHPELFARAARFVSLKEFVWHRWFGEWQVDASLASATGLYNLLAHDWDAGALGASGIEPARLSALVPTTYVRRGVRDAAALQAGLDDGVAINIGASDGVLANLGVGAIGSDLTVITIGTSLAVRTGSARPLLDLATRSFCYVLDTDRYIVGGPSNSGGIVLDWLYRNVLGGPGVNLESRVLPPGFLDLLTAAGRVSGEQLLCLPYITGERAPLWDAEAAGVFFGLRLEHAAADLMRAAVEGIIFNAYWIASPIFQRQGAPRQIVATGKVLETVWIRQVAADVFGIPIRFLGDIDASASGAAALANIATGVWTWDDAVRHLGAVPGTITPPAQPQAYAAKFARFQRLSELLRPEMDAR